MKPWALARRCAAAAAVLALGAGCTATPGTSEDSPASPTSGVAASAAPVTLDITIRNRRVSPNGQRVNLRQGQPVVLKVTSDSEEEVHAHTAGGGYELAVHPEVPASGRFVAADRGTFEVELHHLDLVVAVLVVR